MLIFFKKRQITLDFYTIDPLVYEYARPRPSSSFLPKWWKDLPSEEKNINMKSCRGFTSFFKNSFIIPYWQSLYINVSNANEKRYEWKNSEMPAPSGKDTPSITTHNRDQYSGYLNDNYQHIKLISPWTIKSSHAIEYLWTDPVWTRQDPNLYTILPGSVDYTVNYSSEVNLLFEYKTEPYHIDILPNTPLVMLTPVTEEKVKLDVHLVSEAEYKRLNPQNMFTSIPGLRNFRDVNIYNLKKRFFEEHNEMNASKCPFGFKGKK